MIYILAWGVRRPPICWVGGGRPSQNGVITTGNNLVAAARTGPALVLVGDDGQDARAIHGSSRSATVHPSAFVLNGPRLVVVATLG